MNTFVERWSITLAGPLHFVVSSSLVVHLFSVYKVSFTWTYRVSQCSFDLLRQFCFDKRTSGRIYSLQVSLCTITFIFFKCRQPIHQNRWQIRKCTGNKLDRCETVVVLQRVLSTSCMRQSLWTLRDLSSNIIYSTIKSATAWFLSHTSLLHGDSAPQTHKPQYYIVP